MSSPPMRVPTKIAPSPTWSKSQGLRYGLLGMPLAFCALPLYVSMPHFYATRWGVPLAALGSMLLALRLADALLDPWIGRWCDRWAIQGIDRLWNAMAWAALLLGLAFAGIFNPQVAPAQALGWAAVNTGLAYLAYSVLSVSHQSWGAAFRGDVRQRSTVVAWREGLGLLGVVLASTAPALWGAEALAWVMAPLLVVAMWGLRHAPRPQAGSAAEPRAHGATTLDETTSRTTPGSSLAELPLWTPWRNAVFVRLVLVFALNGVASALPATLVLFFIEDRLQLSLQWQGLFLGLYFLLAAASMPVWLRVVGRLGLERAWLLGMALAIAAFAGALTIGAGDWWVYALVCAASGLALGSDLAIPAAMLSKLSQQHSHADDGAGQAHGLYFGWWNLVTKLNLALAAGLALPLLAWLGYAPGSRDPAALQALTLVYCLLPCAIKASAAALLYAFFIQPTQGKHHAS